MYLSPEVLSLETYGNECDIWSLGVLTYMTLSGAPPFDSEEPYELLVLINISVILISFIEINQGN